MLLARTNVKRKTRAAAGRTQPDFALQKRFKHVFSSPAKIRFVGLFDTVKSVGWIYDPVVIPYTANNRSVQVVRHAVAIDERRCFFRQHLWDTKQADTTDLAEVWFSGVHSDIGGGYPDDKSQLSRVALRWMLSEACKHGLRLDPRTCAKQLTPSGKIGPDPLAEINVSLKGAWWAAEWVPRLVSRGGRDPTRTLEIGAMPPLRRVRPRPMASKTAIHSSVLQRISGRSDYSPVNMPTEFVQIDDAPCLDELLERAAAEPG